MSWNWRKEPQSVFADPKKKERVGTIVSGLSIN